MTDDLLSGMRSQQMQRQCAAQHVAQRGYHSADLGPCAFRPGPRRSSMEVWAPSSGALEQGGSHAGKRKSEDVLNPPPRHARTAACRPPAASRPSAADSGYLAALGSAFYSGAAAPVLPLAQPSQAGTAS